MHESTYSTMASDTIQYNKGHACFLESEYLTVKIDAMISFEQVMITEVSRNIGRVTENLENRK